MEKPKIKECFRVERIADEGVVLISEQDYYWITGRAFIAVTPYLNGENTIDEIITKVDGQVSMPEIFYAIESLKEQGHLVETHQQLPKSIESFWHAQNIDSSKVISALSEKKVFIKYFGELPHTEYIDSFFTASDIKITGEESEADFYLVITDDYDRREISNWNKWMLEKNVPWLIMKPLGTQIWVGPMFNDMPGSACWDCLIQRVRANRQMESYIQNLRNDDTPIITSFSAYPPSVNMALNLAVMEMEKFLVSNGSSIFHNTLVTLNTRHLEMEKHTVVKRPQCKVCGEKSYYDQDRKPEGVTLQSSLKKFRNDGGHRTTLPEILFDKYKHHISSITGVVSSLKRLDKLGDNSLIYTYGAGHNFAMMNHKGMYFMLKNLRGRSGGKGMSDAQAKLSGMCEAIERYSGVYRGDEPRIKAAYKDIKDKALHPYSYLLFSEYQYTNREKWNSDHNSDYHMVPKVFKEDRVIEWSGLTNLRTQELVYVPTGYCYFGHPDIVDYFDTACDANGNAAGASLEETLVQGFLELVERDSVAIWWYNRLQRREIDIESFKIGYLTELIEYYKTINRDLIAIDITSDLGIYSFVAISKRTDKDVQDIVLGFGAHLDPKIALLRAITEVNQFMPCVSNEDINGETQYWFEDPEAIRWWKTATFANQPYLNPTNEPKLTLSDFKDLSKDDLKDDLEVCMAAVEAQGMTTYVLNQTRPDVGLNVAKVIVPGMRHFWKRFGKGRLYDVPVKMGWRETPISEKDLNPIGIFF